MDSSNVKGKDNIEDKASDKQSALRVLFRGFEFIEKVLSLYLAGVLIVCLVVSMCVEIVLRFAFNDSLLGLTACVELAVITITFTSLALVQKEDEHIKVDALLSWLMGRKVGYIINFLTSLAIVALFISIAWVLAKYAIVAYKVGHTTWNIYLPIWPVYALASVSTTIIVVRVFVQTKDNLLRMVSKLKGSTGEKREYDWSKSTLD